MIPHGQRLVLVGGGGHALVVAEAAHEAGWTSLVCVDDGVEPRVTGAMGVQRVGAILNDEGQPAWNGDWILCIGDLASRRGILDVTGEAGARSVFHPLSMVSRSATVGGGTFIAPRAIVHTRARVGAHCIVNSGAIVEHECELGDNVHIAPGAILAGEVRIGRDTLVGIGACVLPGRRVGEGCVIGAGAVVTRDVESGMVVMGVPAGVK